MSQILQATYQNGRLVLNQKLSNVIEGQTLKILVLESNDTALKKSRFLSAVDRHAFKLPKDYHFNRDELHDR